MTCNGCGNPNAYRTFTAGSFEACNSCGNVGKVGMADVYWDGTPEHGLADDPRTGKPLVFGSKGEKAAYLKSKGLIEAGDKIHGAKPCITERRPQQENSRETALRAIQTVKSMGRDYRREKFMEIMKKGRN